MHMPRQKFKRAAWKEKSLSSPTPTLNLSHTPRGMGSIYLRTPGVNLFDCRRNFEDRSVLVQRSVVGGRVDDVKTEYSRDDVPLDARLAEVLLQWRSVSIFPRDEDWLFANPVTGRPYHQESLQKSQIKRAAKLAGLGEDMGWHTFRHSYRSWLDETGAPMKVQQELMRHASIQTTMNVYGRAMTETKRRANSQVVGLVLGPNSQDLPADPANATVQ
jgi:hypothetical protein